MTPRHRKPGLERLSWLLLRLAGRVPDEALAVMRTCVAEAEPETVVAMIADALRPGRLALTADEAAVAGAALRTHGGEARLADQAPRIVGLPPPLYQFATPGGGDPIAAAADEAAVRAAGLVAAGLVGLWRVRRSSGRATVTVRLAEVAPTAKAIEITAEMQQAIGAAGETSPCVEVFAEGADLTPYHEAALAAAALVWSAAALPEIQLARAFDGADPDTGPFFAADHPRVDIVERQRLLDYLRAGEVVLAGSGFMDDVIDPAGVAEVPVSFRSDGRWIWTDAVSYYLDRHSLAPDPALRAHVLAEDGPPCRLTRLARHRVLAALSTAAMEEPKWQPA